MTDWIERRLASLTDEERNALAERGDEIREREKDAQEAQEFLALFQRFTESLCDQFENQIGVFNEKFIDDVMLDVNLDNEREPVFTIDKTSPPREVMVVVTVRLHSIAVSTEDQSAANMAGPQLYSMPLHIDENAGFVAMWNNTVLQDEQIAAYVLEQAFFGSAT